MTATIIRGARLFEDPDAGECDILIQDGHIVALGTAGSIERPGARVRDVTGLLALPGMVDVHVHPIHDETFATVGDAAVHGGVTTVCNHLYPAPEESYRDAIDRMVSEASLGAADFGAHLRWDPTRSTEDLTALAAHGGLSVKVFLAYPDKQIQANLDDLVTAMTQTAAAGLPTVVHAELGNVVDRLLEHGLADRTNHENIHRWRSTHNEAAAVTAAASVARATGAHLYVVHVSCQEAMEACERARSEGVQISVETCPHYLFLTHADAPEGGEGFVLPPLREPADRDYLRGAVSRGVVDTVGSDHCGHGPAAKLPHDIPGSKAGLPGIETLSRLLIDAALGDEAWVDPRRVVDLLAAGPARVFNLPGKGALAPGYDADIALIDPNAVVAIDADQLHQAAAYTPYQGRQLRGEIQEVWRRGELVLDAGKAVATTGGRMVGGTR